MPINNKSVYFTIKPHQTGFSDQLNQFNALYRLGNHLGYKYYHKNFSSMRSTYGAWNFRPDFFSRIELIVQLLSRIFKYKILKRTNDDIFNFLGFNQYFKKKNDNINLREFAKIKIVLSAQTRLDNDLSSFDKLKDYILENVNKYSSEKKLVIFDVKHERVFLRQVFLNIPRHKNQIFLRDQYFAIRQKSKWISKFDSKRLKVLVHIRKGDTAYIETPWNSFISVYFANNNSFKELENISQLTNNNHIDISDYSAFIKKANSHLCREDVFFLCFSDGFKRTFEKIYRAKRKLKLTRSKLKLLVESEKNYNERYFSPLAEFDNTLNIIGENKNKLFDLMHSVFEADIIVVGNRQRMITQFVCAYFDITNMPTVVVMYRKKIPYFPFLEKDVYNDKFIFIDVDNPNYKEVFSRISVKVSGN